MAIDRLESLQAMVSQNPNDSFARYGLAMEYATKGESENALNQFARLLAANPDYTAAYQMSAQVLIKAGREAEARTMLDEGIKCAIRTKNQHARSEMAGMLDELR